MQPVLTDGIQPGCGFERPREWWCQLLGTRRRYPATSSCIAQAVALTYRLSTGQFGLGKWLFREGPQSTQSSLRALSHPLAGAPPPSRGAAITG